MAITYSMRVKEELLSHVAKARHCQLAGLAAILKMEGSVTLHEMGGGTIYIRTDNVISLRKCFTILKKAFNIDTDILDTVAEKRENGHVYKAIVNDADAVSSILMALKEINEDGTLRENRDVVSPLLLRNQCCKRAFLRDTFLCIGSISDPKKSYHLEFVCESKEQANQILDVLRDFELQPKMVIRKKYYVVYLKEGEEIVDLLNIMEAHISLMELENLRIYKDMRNSVNRRVNCEAANITKTVNAASRQTKDIQYIQQHYGFNRLSEGMRQMAEVRLEHPDATLAELGAFLDPPVGKSGVNHRLRKLSELADRLRT
ncbi:DNA-binding protein WhiA [Butyrivibrio sp. NC3005]|uniref:DNA-binding protein WhiA n=1 Tax=Butyrivibrio sp. NC3005 TaxID=1280685 RepID=UPI0004122CCA|nr:DNA-binding protein WhiA [Butyrivibrio sp. NC3005]